MKLDKLKALAEANVSESKEREAINKLFDSFEDKMEIAYEAIEAIRNQLQSAVLKDFLKQHGFDVNEAKSVKETADAAYQHVRKLEGEISDLHMALGIRADDVNEAKSTVFPWVKKMFADGGLRAPSSPAALDDEGDGHWISKAKAEDFIAKLIAAGYKKDVKNTTKVWKSFKMKDDPSKFIMFDYRDPDEKNRVGIRVFDSKYNKLSESDNKAVSAVVTKLAKATGGTFNEAWTMFVGGGDNTATYLNKLVKMGYDDGGGWSENKAWFTKHGVSKAEYDLLVKASL